MPVAGLEEWMSKSEDERKDAETAAKGEWDAWIAAHAGSVKNTIAFGKTKRVNANGIEDVKNGFMLSSYVEGESLESVAELFKDHPHLKLPGATIEIMETKPLTGM